MKFVSVQDFSTSSAYIWNTLPEEQEMVLTNNGKPVALLTPLSDSNFENTLASIRACLRCGFLRSIDRKNPDFRLFLEPARYNFGVCNAKIRDLKQALRQAKAIQAVKLIQQESIKQGMDTTTMEEIDEEIRRIRKETKR
jgi:antitoxin (DNA-binding transcriptional repressor) of toxin-antitoxin stability system